MRDGIIKTLNTKKLLAASAALLDRPRGMPGLAVVWGAAGSGKTTIAKYVALSSDGVWIEALPDWTSRWMLGDLAVELGAAREKTAELNFRAARGALLARPRAVFIDEADRLCDRMRLAETLRALHDATTASIVLIGMHDLPPAIRRLPQIASRVAHRIEFKACDLKDVRAFADGLAEIGIADDLIGPLHTSTAGSARLVCAMLEKLETFARRRAKRVLKFADLPTNFFDAGDRSQATDEAGEVVAESRGDLKQVQADAA